MTGGDSPQRASDQAQLIAAAWRQAEPLWSTAAQGSSAGSATGGAEAPTIPGYRIEGELQRGGQGVVYRGVQESTQRAVAIKVMRDGPFAGPRERARFEREVQILAQLRHPNIVTIHDSGVAGHAMYFVMDYIPGEPLDRYVAAGAADLRTRLGLFAKICAAVNVAHLRGVIHRDLKPGNLRVDPAGEPHVLDFGLAKRSAREDRDETLDMTVTGQFIGSLPWASPEQAEGRSDEIDLRTDVYSLGVILYQLLTGDFPYEVSGSIGQTTQNIVHREARHPRSLNRRLDDEVCTIVLKALRKNRDERYQTAGALGRDVERYLAGEPLEAKRDSVTYILRKQLARHKFAAGVVAGFLALIVAGFVISLSFWRQAVVARNAEAAERSHAEHNAEVALDRAERAATEAAKAAAINAFLAEMLESASPSRGGRADVTVHEALDAAAGRLAAGAFQEQPQVAASIRRVLGTTYAGLGLFPAASEQLAAARGLYDKLGQSMTPEGVDCAYRLADAQRNGGELDSAEALFGETLAAVRKQFGDHHKLVAMGLNGLAGVLRDRDRLTEAEALSRESLAIVRALPDSNPEDVADTLNDLALVLDRQAERAEAQALYTEACDIYRKARGPRSRPLAVATSNLAGVYANAGDYVKAAELYGEALAILREVAGERHPDVASALSALGLLHLKTGAFVEAAGELAESLAMRREVLGHSHPLVAQTLNNLAIAQYQLGDLAQATATYQEAIALWGEDQPGLPTIKGNLAAILRMQGRYDEAIPLLRDALAAQTAVLRPGHPGIATAQHNLGRTLADTGEYAEAESLLRSAVATRREAYGGEHSEVASSLEALAEVLTKQQRLDEAEATAGEALAMRRKLFGDDHVDVAYARHTLGLILLAAKRADEATLEFQDALRLAAAGLPAGHWRTAMIRSDLGEALRQCDRLEEAETTLRAAHAGLVAALGEDDSRTQTAAARLAAVSDANTPPSEAE